MPPRAAPLPPDERRAAIVSAVTPMLADLGDDATSRQLAHAAGVAEGTIFNAFGDKDALIQAVIDAALDPEPFERSVAELDTGGDLETLLVEVTRLVQRRTHDIWKLMSALGPRHHRAGPRRITDSPAVAAVFAAHADQLTVSPLDAARLLRGLTLATAHPLLASRPMPAEQVVDLLLHGIVVDRTEATR